jgi:hypothetical protein
MRFSTFSSKSLNETFAPSRQSDKTVEIGSRDFNYLSSSRSHRRPLYYLYWKKIQITCHKGNFSLNSSFCCLVLHLLFSFEGARALLVAGVWPQSNKKTIIWKFAKQSILWILEPSWKFCRNVSC